MFGPRHTLKSLLQDLEKGLRSGEIKLREHDPATFQLAIGNGSPANTNRDAEDLRQALLKAAPTVNVEECRQGSNGTPADLMICLDSDAALAVARQLSAWLRSRPNARINLMGQHTRFVAELATIEDPAWLTKLVEAEQAAAATGFAS